MLVRRLLTVLALGACGPGSIADTGPAPDRDDDGLSDVKESEIGSNPDEADTDHDGWDDGVEVANYTDPLNGFDHPYDGGWPIASCRNDLEAGANVVENFSLMDQFGDPLRLHDFCDRYIVMPSAAGWCEPCRVEAAMLSTLFKEHEANGLMVITLLGEDANNRTPNLEVLQEWASEANDATFAVVQDTSFSITQSYTGGGGALPLTQFIAPGGILVHRNVREFTTQDVLDFIGQ